MTTRNQFLQYLAPTSFVPLCLEIEKAKGVYLFSKQQKYLDAISGINVSYLGHSNKTVIKAVHQQLKKYAHLMVYGEIIQSPQVEYAKMLVQHLPKNLNNVYFTNSGSEAIEAAMKLSKRSTGRTKIFAFNNSYHGSTQGALSLMGNEYWRNAYRPLLPNVYHFNYNEETVFNHLDTDVACVILEPIQAEAGIIKPLPHWIKKLRTHCEEKKILFVLDEIQTGFGRTENLWAFENLNIVPDILVLGKALGGGLPLGAIIADFNLMKNFAAKPVLGHITTFGGNPISCQAGMATFKLAFNNNVFEKANANAEFFRQQLNQLKHKNIVAIRHQGLWAAIEFSSPEICISIVNKCIQKGLLTDWFLFSPKSLRLAPPLTITTAEIKKIFTILKTVF